MKSVNKLLKPFEDIAKIYAGLTGCDYLDVQFDLNEIRDILEDYIEPKIEWKEERG